MFSALPREIVWKILDIYAEIDTENSSNYMSLRTVNKQICAHVLKSARDYIRNYWRYFSDRPNTTYDDYMSDLHSWFLSCDPLKFRCRHARHKYLPIWIKVSNSWTACVQSNNFKIATFSIYIGKCKVVFDIGRAPCTPFAPGDGKSPIIMITRVGCKALRSHAWVINFIKEYFNELYIYLASSPCVEYYHMDNEQSLSRPNLEDW
jgi:hypothetical protein